MVVVRFENDAYDGKNDDYINKLVFFDKESGMIKVKKLEKQMNTKTEFNQINDIIKSCFTSDKVKYRIIDLPPVEGSYSSPFKLYIDITDKCQLNCSHCLTKYLNENNEIPISTIKEIAEECKRLCKNECTATRWFFNRNINIADPNCLRRKEDDYER